MKNIIFFYLKFFNFLVVKFSVYLNRHVFDMQDSVFSYGADHLFFVRERHTDIPSNRFIRLLADEIFSHIFLTAKKTQISASDLQRLRFQK